MASPPPPQPTSGTNPAPTPAVPPAATTTSNSSTATTTQAQSARQQAREAALSKVLHWLFFGVIFAVMPIIAGLLINASRLGSLGFWSLIGRGELLIVTAGLAAAAAGQIFTKKSSRRHLMSSFLAFSNIVIACLSSIVYANISAGLQEGDKVNEGFVGVLSLVFFGITLVTAGSSALIVELEDL